MCGERDVDLLSDVASYLGIFHEKKIFEIKIDLMLKNADRVSEDFFCFFPSFFLCD